MPGGRRHSPGAGGFVPCAFFFTAFFLCRSSVGIIWTIGFMVHFFIFMVSLLCINAKPHPNVCVCVCVHTSMILVGSAKVSPAQPLERTVLARDTPSLRVCDSVIQNSRDHEGPVQGHPALAAQAEAEFVSRVLFISQIRFFVTSSCWTLAGNVLLVKEARLIT